MIVGSETEKFTARMLGTFHLWPSRLASDTARRTGNTQLSAASADCVASGDCTALTSCTALNRDNRRAGIARAQAPAAGH